VGRVLVTGEAYTRPAHHKKGGVAVEGGELRISLLPDAIALAEGRGCGRRWVGAVCGVSWVSTLPWPTTWAHACALRRVAASGDTSGRAGRGDGGSSGGQAWWGTGTACASGSRRSTAGCRRPSDAVRMPGPTFQPIRQADAFSAVEMD
jgi:hypothetical protein